MDYLSLCLICKDENDYLPEWLDYHILVGVERFYIYDNDSRVSLREDLRSYIERGWVVVIDISGSAMQLYAYDHCLQTYGAGTFWLGFIDTDEFLVPRSTSDLKELLREYEAFGGLAVSSLFFGSDGHQQRPEAGQIASYTRRVHEGYREFDLVKSIVQPAKVFLPNSPHDFLYKNENWCVNEKRLRVDGQRFPCSIQKIQLNHYYCRSEAEIDLKLGRGNSGAVAWPRRRFEAVNKLAVINDDAIFHCLINVFSQAGYGESDRPDEIIGSNLVERLSGLASKIAVGSMPGSCPLVADSFRSELSETVDYKTRINQALGQHKLEDAKDLMLQLLQRTPGNINLLVDLAIILLELNDYSGAWQVLTRAWQYSANNYLVLGGMVFYFLRIQNFVMAESTCRLLLEIGPHEIQAMGFLTEALLGQGRFEEGLKVGLPVIEFAAVQGELPDGMGLYLVKKMADYLVTIRDYAGAVGVWQMGVKCQPGEISALVELGEAFLLAGNIACAREQLEQARILAPENELILGKLRQIDELRPAPKKRSH